MSRDFPSADEVIVVRPGAAPAGVDCLDVPSARDAREETVRDWSGIFLDAALVRLTVAREVLPAWTAHLLQRMEATHGYLQLGRASIRDYAREDLGLTPWQVRDLRRLGAGLARFPSLRGAMLAGKVSEATARRLLKALGDDSEVAPWLERLETAPSRLAFNEAVDDAAKARAAAGEPPADPLAAFDVRYERLDLSLLGAAPRRPRARGRRCPRRRRR